MGERKGGRKVVRPERIIKAPEDRVQRASYTLPFEVVDFLRKQGNADKYLADLVYREIKKKETLVDD